MRLVISTLGEITQQANSLLSRSFGRKGANIRTQKTNLLVLSLTNTRCNSLYALGQAAREHKERQLENNVIWTCFSISSSETSRYNPFALRRSSITRSDRALYFVFCISYFVLSYITLSLRFVLFSFVSSLKSQVYLPQTEDWKLLLPTVFPISTFVFSKRLFSFLFILTSQI